MVFKVDSVFQVSNNIVFRKQADGNYILLEVEGDRIFHLEEVSAFIWEKIFAKFSYGGICEALSEEYDDFGETEVSYMNEFLLELIDKKIVQISK